MQLLRVVGCLVVAIVLTFWIASSRGEARGTISNSVMIVQMDPHRQGTLLAGTSTAMLFRTRDGANTWTELRFPASFHATLHTVLIDPINPHTYLVALSSEMASYAGVFRSVDEGATWHPISDLSLKQVWSLTSWAADGRVMAAGAQDGVYLSRDGGETWTPSAGRASSGPRPVVSLAFDPANRDILYAGTPHLAWKTTDGGKTWRQMHKGMEEDSDIFSIAVDAINPRRVLMGTCGGIYSSLDGGGTWANLAGAVGVPSRTYVVARMPRNTRVVFAGTSEGLLESADAGTTWRRVFRRAVRSIAFDYRKPERMFVATDRGILRSEDGGAHFTEASQGLYGRLFASAAGESSRDSGQSE